MAAYKTKGLGAYLAAIGFSALALLSGCGKESQPARNDSRYNISTAVIEGNRGYELIYFYGDSTMEVRHKEESRDVLLDDKTMTPRMREIARELRDLNGEWKFLEDSLGYAQRQEKRKK